MGTQLQFVLDLFLILNNVASYPITEVHKRGGAMNNCRVPRLYPKGGGARYAVGKQFSLDRYCNKLNIHNY